MPRVKDWCFTINNPSEEDWEAVWSLVHKYLVFQVELGDSGTPHIQGFVQMSKRTTLERMRRLLHRAHFEQRQGTAEQAAHYCKKPVPDCRCRHCDGLVRFDDYHESGELDTTEQGQRTDLSVATDLLRTDGLAAVKEQFPTVFIRYPRGFESLAQHYVKPRDFQTIVTVIFGEPGSGKTRYGMTGPLPYKLNVLGEGTDFFGAYDPRVHQTVVVDDFYGGWRYTTFLQVADRYPCEVPVKGGFVQFTARHLVFTSNKHPHLWYPKVLADTERRGSFDRRIHNLIRFTAAGYAIVKVSQPLLQLFLSEIFRHFTKHIRGSSHLECRNGFSNFR